jgi:hypothetical protein
LPNYILYMNAYYITGMVVSLKPLMCTGDEGQQYLKYAPQIECWGEQHTRILAFDAIAVTLYFGALPGTIAYVLFWLVPKYGLHNQRLTVAFGFLWSRFEARIYWWEIMYATAVPLLHMMSLAAAAELPCSIRLSRRDMVRKIGLVIVSLTVDDPVTQSLSATVCVGFVMVLNFANKPFIRDVYDYLDATGCSVQVIILLLGVSVFVRRSNASPAAVENTGMEEVYILVAVLVCYCVAMIIVFSYDVALIEAGVQVRRPPQPPPHGLDISHLLPHPDGTRDRLHGRGTLAGCARAREQERAPLAHRFPRRAARTERRVPLQDLPQLARAPRL